MNKSELGQMAKKVRLHIIEEVGAAKCGHPGGSLSAADILTVLYFEYIDVDPKKPDWPDRDRFVLSKGHAAPLLYAILAEKGFFPVKDLKSLRKLGSRLQGHPDVKRTPGIDASTGSLGQGLSQANGMALAGKLDKKNYQVYAMIGDGECQEGQIWEAAMTASHYKLDNLIAFLDYNRLQIDGEVGKIMKIEPIAEKWKAFGWNVQEIDGHNIQAIGQAIEKAQKVKGKPSMIICHTTKGKGVSFMENVAGWHGKAPKGELLDKALEELK